MKTPAGEVDRFAGHVADVAAWCGALTQREVCPGCARVLCCKYADYDGAAICFSASSSVVTMDAPNAASNSSAVPVPMESSSRSKARE